MLSATYAFAELVGAGQAKSWPDVAVELAQICALLPLLRTDLGAPWKSTDAAVDASDFGIGVCRRSLDPNLAGRLGRASERWRYKVEGAVAARRNAMEGDDEPDPEPHAVTDITTGRPTEFHEVPNAILNDADWSVVLAGRVENRNILELEGWAAVLCFR